MISVDRATDAINIVLATDRNFLPFCATTIRSCIDATPGRALRFFVLHQGDISDGDQRLMTEMVLTAGADAGVVFSTLSAEALRVFPTKGPELGGRISWARLLMPQQFPDLGRAIYLDADVLVRRPLDELWGVGLGEDVAAAARNVVEPAMHRHVTELGIEEPRDYFNAGVLLVDLDALREQGLDRELIEFATSKQLFWFDQDALNVVLRGAWRPLHPKWNVQNSMLFWRQWSRDVFGDGPLAEAIGDPAILHFEGPAFAKPWHYLSQHPYALPYRATLATTPWAARGLDGRNAVTWLIRRLPKQRQLATYARMTSAADRLTQRMRRRRSRAT